MRILIANSGHPSTIKGGAEAASRDLALGLVNRGHHVAMVVHHDQGYQCFHDEGVQVYALPNKNIYYGFDGKPHHPLSRLLWHGLDSANPFMAKAVGFILDEEKPDLVNSHALAGLSPLIWQEAKKRYIPVVHYLHEYGLLCPKGSGFKKEKTCKKACFSCKIITKPRHKLSSLVQDVVGVSHYTLQRHLDWGYFPNARTHVLPNVFHGLDFKGRKSASHILRLGYFGRLIPDKGAHLLVEAVKHLPSQGWTLDIAGTGEEDYIKSLLKDNNPHIRLLGWTTPQDFFDNIDVMVLPSLWPDPQPRVTFEAFMHGVPVIGAKAGGISEEIDEGQTGWLFEAGSAANLTHVINHILQTRCDQSLAAENFAARLQHLDPIKVLPGYESIFTQAIKKNKL